MANEDSYKDMEIGFTRKRDGKAVNIKLMDVFKCIATADFVNNEVKINGETFIADSVRSKYQEVTLSVIKKSFNGGNGSIQYNGVSYDTDQSFNVQQNSIATVTFIPDSNSKINSVKDEKGNAYEVNNGVVNIIMNDNHTLTVEFDILLK